MCRSFLVIVLASMGCSDKNDTGDGMIYDGDADGSPAAEDCDDGDPDVYPGAPEYCDITDNDCDGDVDEDPADAATWQFDGDGDTYGIEDVGQQVSSCTKPDGYADNGDDCDDDDPAVHPYAQEVCDDIDNDCDGDIDTDSENLTTWYGDLDGDLHGDPKVMVNQCDAPKGYVDDNSDCDDTNDLVHPDVVEECNGYDDDCDGADEYCNLPLSDLSVKLLGEAEGDLAGLWIDSGDTNGDHQGDVLVGSPFQPTKTNAGASYIVEGPVIDDVSLGDATATYVGSGNEHMAGAIVGGDVDGDAISDVAVGAVGNDTVYVSMGPISAGTYNLFLVGATETKIAAEAAGDGLGGVGSYDIVGDTTGDLRDDFAFGTPNEESGGIDAGAVYFFFGDNVTGDINLADAFGKYTGAAGESAGSLVVGVGDTDANGFDDYVVGAPGSDTVYLVGHAIADTTLDSAADAILEGPPSTGTSAAGADVNDDGNMDLLIGAPSAQGGKGQVYVVYGPVSGTLDLSSAADIVLTGELDGDAAGSCVGGGDVNGDLVADLVVGAPGEDATATDAGATYAIFGSTAMAGTYELGRIDRKYVGAAAGDRVGTACAVVEDVSDDNVGDLATSATGADNGTGTVYIVYSGDIILPP